MKKVFAICLALVMVFSLGLNVMAAPNNFIESPSNNRAPIIIDCKNESEDCTAIVVITPYGDRDNLSDEQKKNFEDAYNQIVNADSIEDMFSGINSVLPPGSISTDLSVSDMFNMSYKDCDTHGTHGRFTIQLQPETLKGFVGLIQFIDGEWVLIEDAKVDGNYLSFTAKDLSTFAIVVDRTKAQATSPVTGTPLTSYIVYGAVFATAALALVVVFAKKKAN